MAWNSPIFPKGQILRVLTLDKPWPLYLAWHDLCCLPHLLGDRFGQPRHQANFDHWIWHGMASEPKSQGHIQRAQMLGQTLTTGFGMAKLKTSTPPPLIWGTQIFDIFHCTWYGMTSAPFSQPWRQILRAQKLHDQLPFDLAGHELRFPHP